MHLPVDYRTLRFSWLRDKGPLYGIDLRGVSAGGGILVILLSPALTVAGVLGSPGETAVVVPIAFLFYAIALCADMWPLICGLILLGLSGAAVLFTAVLALATALEPGPISFGSAAVLGLYLMAVATVSARHVARWESRAQTGQKRQTRRRSREKGVS